MYKILSLLLPLAVFAQEDFISHYEYGRMLFHNPRGVSCAKCHDHDGSGKVIATYKDKTGNVRTLRGPDIREVDYETLIETLSRKHPVMPRYYLTDEEVRTIYDYLRSEKKRD